MDLKIFLVLQLVVVNYFYSCVDVYKVHQYHPMCSYGLSQLFM